MYSLPLAVPEVDLNFWFKALGHLLQKPLPEAHEGLEPFGQPISVDERTAWPWWKVCFTILLMTCASILVQLRINTQLSCLEKY
jgi:hypothetical protein